MELERIEALMVLMRDYGLAELELDESGDRIALRMPVAVIAATVATAAVAPQAGPAAAAPHAAVAEGKVVKAPMVATFYRAAKPGSPPFVEIGDKVAAGQVVCILEAMKMMNEIEADAGGTVAEILVEDGQPVQFGQPLIRIV